MSERRLLMIAVPEDLRLAGRLLKTERAYALAVVLTLSFGIGTNAALFAVVDHVLLNPLPYRDASRILHLYNSYPRAGAAIFPIRAASAAGPDYFDRMRAVDALEEQALYNYRNLSVGPEGSPHRVLAMVVTPSFFRVLGVAPALGRVFDEQEGQLGNEQRVVLSAALWRDLFASDPSVIGKDLRVDSRPYRIVGVMPRGFEFEEPEVGVWIPAALTPAQRSDDSRHSNVFGYIARLKLSATIQQVQTQLDALNAANRPRFPRFEGLYAAGFRTIAVPLQDEVVRAVRRTLSLLWGATWCVLLIACVNVANLGVLRFRQRVKELATRAMLGAGRWRMVRQLLVEQLVLVGLAVGAGLLLANWALGAFIRFNPLLPRASEIHVDMPVIAYSAIILLLIAVAMAALPLLVLMPANLVSALREAGRHGTTGRHGRRTRRVLVVAEIAFAFLLVNGAGLFLASFRRVLDVDPGFRARGVLTMATLLPTTSYPDTASIRRGVEAVVRRVREVPQVEHVGATTWIPFGSLGRNQWSLVPEGFTFDPGRFPMFASRVLATPGFLEAMGVRLRDGRYFDDRDNMKGQSVAIVDERLARRLWPDANAVGKRLYFSIGDAKAMKPEDGRLVVGVTSDVTLLGLDEGRDSVGTFYIPYAQLPDGQIWRIPFLAIKSAAPPTALIDPVRAALTAVDREVPQFDVQTMEARTEKSLGSRRAGLLVLVSLGLVGIVLAGIGIYGVVGYWVRQRSREFGIRLALGSTVARILVMVVQEGFVLTAAGVAAGVLGAAVLSSLLRSHLYEVEPTSPLIMAIAAVAVACVALSACAAPARRAGRIDPVRELGE